MEAPYKVKKSKISGKGVCALKDIKKGQTICVLEGDVRSLDEIIKMANEGTEHPSDPLLVGNEKYLDLNEVSRTFNHSCDPNAYVKGRNKLTALKDIKKGEEMTFDYSTTMDDNEEKIKKAGRVVWTCKCNCKSFKCRGIINQFKTLPRETQLYYLERRLMPDFMLKKFKKLLK